MKHSATVVFVLAFVGLAASEAQAGFSVSLDGGPEFGFRSGVLAGATATLTMGGEWDRKHRIAGKGTLILLDPASRAPGGGTWGGALLVAYRYRPGWRVEPFVEVAAGVAGLEGHFVRVGSAVYPWGFMATAAGGVRFAWNKKFALFADLHVRGWVTEHPAALWGVTGGIEF